MKHFAWLLVLLASPALAAPFVICDPYEATAVQPDSFVITFANNPTPVVVPATKTTTGLNYLHYDAGALHGQQTITVKARNTSGDSAASTPFSFTVGAPTTPVGITLSNQ